MATMIHNRLWLILPAICLALMACQEKPMIYSLEEAKLNISRPLYQVDTETRYTTITTMYKVFEDSSEGIIDIYFLDMSSDDPVRVARLRTCSACTLIGSYIGSPDELGDSITLSIGEPFNQTAYTCNAGSNTLATELYDGQLYITCLYWIDNEGYGNKIYSIWDYQETILFLESLLRINQ